MSSPDRFPPPVHYAPLAAPPPRPPRRPGPMLLLGLAIGLVLGGGGVALGWVLSSGSPTGADAEAQAACQVVQGDSLPIDARNITMVEIHRWSGAGELAAAAGATDPRYKPLGTAMTKVEAGLEQYDLDAPRIRAAAQQAQAFCAAR